jgi:hypothetical protein
MAINLGPPRGTWKTDRGEVSTWILAPGLYATRAAGHIEVELSSKIVAGGNEVIREHGKLLAFHDWQGIQTYETDARKQLTDWAIGIRGKVERVHLLTGSKLVRMGVAVASIALGDMVTAYEDRTVFEKLLQDAIAATRGRPA